MIALPTEQRLGSLLGRTVRSAARRSLRLLQNLSPFEREFARVWPRIDAIDGLLVPGQERWLFRAARRLPAGGNAVEIGSYKGRSTTCLAFGCRAVRAHLYAIDTFDGNSEDFTGAARRRFFHVWRENLRANRLEPWVTPLLGDSALVARQWTAPIDLLFIDGCHLYESALADFDNFYPYVVPGGCIAMHDVGSHAGPTCAWRDRLHLLSEIGSCASLAFGRKPRGAIC